MGAIVSLILFFALIAGGWLLSSHLDYLQNKNGDEHDKIVEAIQTQAEEMKIQTYILSLPPEERRKLRLEMPYQLRLRLWRERRQMGDE